MRRRLTAMSHRGFWKIARRRCWRWPLLNAAACQWEVYYFKAWHVGLKNEEASREKMQRQSTETVVSVLLTTVWLCQLKLANVHHITHYITSDSEAHLQVAPPFTCDCCCWPKGTKLFQRLFSVTLLHNVQTTYFMTLYFVNWQRGNTKLSRCI